MVMGLVSMALVSSLKTEPTSAIVMKDGMVWSAMFRVNLSVDGNIALVLCDCEAAKAPSTEDCCCHEIFVHLIHMTSFCMQRGIHMHDSTRSIDFSLHAKRNPYA